jgi:hypothetical protein
MLIHPSTIDSTKESIIIFTFTTCRGRVIYDVLMKLAEMQTDQKSEQTRNAAYQCNVRLLRAAHSLITPI